MTTKEEQKEGEDKLAKYAEAFDGATCIVSAQAFKDFVDGVDELVVPEPPDDLKVPLPPVKKSDDLISNDEVSITYG